jgi:hypothetical protein
MSQVSKDDRDGERLRQLLARAEQRHALMEQKLQQQQQQQATQPTNPPPKNKKNKKRKPTNKKQNVGGVLRATPDGSAPMMATNSSEQILRNEAEDVEEEEEEDAGSAKKKKQPKQKKTSKKLANRAADDAENDKSAPREIFRWSNYLAMWLRRLELDDVDGVVRAKNGPLANESENFSDEKIWVENKGQSIADKVTGGYDFVAAPTLPICRVAEQTVPKRDPKNKNKAAGDENDDDEKEDEQTIVSIPSMQVNVKFLAAAANLAEMAKMTLLQDPAKPIGPQNPLLISISDKELRRQLGACMHLARGRMQFPSRDISQLAMQSATLRDLSTQALDTFLVPTLASLIPTPLHLLDEELSHAGADEKEVLEWLMKTFYARSHADRFGSPTRGATRLDGLRHGIDNDITPVEREHILIERVRAVLRDAPSATVSSDQLAQLRTLYDQLQSASEDHKHAPPQQQQKQQKQKQEEDKNEDEDEESDEEKAEANKLVEHFDAALLLDCGGNKEFYRAYRRVLHMARRYAFDEPLDVRALLTKDVPAARVVSLQVWASDGRVETLIGTPKPTLARGRDGSRKPAQHTPARALAALGRAIATRQNDAINVDNIKSPHDCVLDKAVLFANAQMRALMVSEDSEQAQRWFYLNPTLELALALLEGIHPMLTFEKWVEQDRDKRMLYLPMPRTFGKKYYPSGRFPTAISSIAARSVTDRIERAIEAAKTDLEAQYHRAEKAAVNAEQEIEVIDKELQQARKQDKQTKKKQQKKKKARTLDPRIQKLIDARKKSFAALKDAEAREEHLSKAHIGIDVEKFTTMQPDDSDTAYIKNQVPGATEEDIVRAAGEHICIRYVDLYETLLQLSSRLANHDNVLNIATAPARDMDGTLFLMLHPVTELHGDARGTPASVAGMLSLGVDYAH